MSHFAPLIERGREANVEQTMITTVLAALGSPTRARRTPV
jgi:hypothetical protein